MFSKPDSQQPIFRTLINHANLLLLLFLFAVSLYLGTAIPKETRYLLYFFLNFPQFTIINSRDTVKNMGAGKYILDWFVCDSFEYVFRTFSLSWERACASLSVPPGSSESHSRNWQLDLLSSSPCCRQRRRRKGGKVDLNHICAKFQFKACPSETSESRLSATRWEKKYSQQQHYLTKNSW